MELKFDNEIDAILRGVAKEPNFANSPTEHPDADLISAFAENVLTGDVRLRAISHFADCNRCRMILTNIVKLNSESEQEIAHTIATPIIETKKVSWFETLFTVPNLAYTFGALTLVFVGIIGLTFLQSKDSEVAFSTKQESIQSKGSSGASSDGNEIAKEAYSANSNTITSNSSPSVANAVVNSSMPATNATTSANSTTINPKDVSINNGITNSATKNQSIPKSINKDLGRSEDKVSQPTTDVDEKENERAITLAEPLPKPTPTPTEERLNDALKSENLGGEDEAVRGGQAKPKKKITEPKINSQNAPATAITRKEDATGESAMNDKTVGGKTFRNVNGIWTDSAYTGGGTKTVKRNSDDYKKLDQVLQSIGNSFRGTVIVVWSGNAYKIQ